MTTRAKNVLLILAVVGTIFAGFYLFLFAGIVDVKKEKHELDSLEREKRYIDFVDSLNRARNAETLEKYYKAHPDERPKR